MTDYKVKPFILRDLDGFLSKTYTLTSTHVGQNGSVFGGSEELSLERIDRPASRGLLIGDVYFPVREGTTNVEWKNVWRPGRHANNIQKAMNGQHVENKGISANLTAIFAAAAFSLMTLNSIFSELSEEQLEKKGKERIEEVKEREGTLASNPETAFCRINITRDIAGNRVYVINSSILSHFKYDYVKNLRLGTHDYSGMLNYGNNTDKRITKFSDCDFSSPDSYAILPENMAKELTNPMTRNISFWKLTGSALQKEGLGDELIFVLQNMGYKSNGHPDIKITYDFEGQGRDINIGASDFTIGVNNLALD